MEEADALSDRIAIIDNGKIEYCGSPLFLKNTFGEGYKLTVSKREDFNETKLKKLISAQIPEYTIQTNVACEISVCIPKKSINTLPIVLLHLEQEADNVGINSYGISSSTIEEVFLK